MHLVLRRSSNGDSANSARPVCFHEILEILPTLKSLRLESWEHRCVAACASINLKPLERLDTCDMSFCCKRTTNASSSLQQNVITDFFHPFTIIGALSFGLDERQFYETSGRAMVPGSLTDLELGKLPAHLLIQKVVFNIPMENDVLRILKTHGSLYGIPSVQFLFLPLDEISVQVLGSFVNDVSEHVKSVKITRLSE